MFTQWFGTPPSRSPKKDLAFRPWLERLEERNAPSAMTPMDPGHGHGPPNPPPGPPHPPPPPGPVSNGISSNVNAHSSFNGSTITDSFNNTINNTVILMPGQQSAVAGLFGLSFGLANALSSPQLGSLLADEVALGVDTYLNDLGASKLIPSLSGDISNLNAAISANALSHTALGGSIGALAFNATMSALNTAQPTI